MQYFKVVRNKDEEVIRFNDTTPQGYLRNFQWEGGRYTRTRPISSIIETIESEVSKIDEDLKVLVSAFTSVDTILQKQKRNETGNLLSRDLSSILEGMEIFESEYMTTIFVVVPSNEIKTFLKTYENFTEFVLPRSAEQLVEDNDYSLFSVVTFKQFIDDFRNKARDSKCTVRTVSENSHGMSAEQKDKLTSKRNKRERKLTRYCQTQFGELFTAWSHIKCIKVFVESALRYGLPAQYEAIIIQPNKSQLPKVKKALDDHYAHLNDEDDVGINEELAKNSMTFLGTDEFHPYVFMELIVEKFGK
jgi:V-type H+-transporting ATPase subunit C